MSVPVQVKIRWFLLAFILVGGAAPGFAADPTFRDFTWETRGDQLVFKIACDRLPAIRGKDELSAKRYFYFDFYNLDGPKEDAEWKLASPLISHVKRVYYKKQRVLRFVFYAARPGALSFMQGAQGGTCLITVGGLNPAAPAKAVHKIEGAKLVVIDPGHGGMPDDPTVSQGASTSRRYNGRYWQEREITLAVAQDLEAYIAQAQNLDSFMTRREDRYVSLDSRLTMALQSHGDLFLSIHMNGTSTRRKRARGFEIYYLSDGTRATNRELASVENEESHNPTILTGQEKDVRHQILRSLADDKFQQRQAESRQFCEFVDQEMVAYGPFRAYDRGVKAEAFRVLLNYNMPAALAECGFLDNPDEGRQLVQPAVQRKIAALLFNAINRYFASVDPTFEPHRVPVDR